MSAVEISQEERDLWRFEATDECGTPSEDDERILRLLKALEASEADLERSCEETRANFSELYRMANEVVPELKRRIEASEAENVRLTKALETQRGLAASSHATALAAWGGEIPSPFPGHKPPSEEAMVELFEHLNCPLCGGSGHIDDCDQTSAEAVARLAKMVDFMAQQMADVYSTDEDGRYVLTCPVRTLRAADHDCDKISCPQCWKEAARRAVAAGEE